jgi:hypothetical protein
MQPMQPFTFLPKFVCNQSAHNCGKTFLPQIYTQSPRCHCPAVTITLQILASLVQILPIFIYVFKYETSHLHQEPYIQTSFSPLLHHLAMLLCLPLYALEWLGFTLNHVTQSKRNSRARVISSCYNLPIRIILQTKASPQFTSFRQVTSRQLNIYDECGEHAYTPKTSQQTVQIASSRISHLEEIPCLRHIQTDTLSKLNQRPSWISKSSHNHLQVTKVHFALSNVPYQR